MDTKISKRLPSVVVVGGGIMGASTAMYLSKRKTKVTVIERFKVAGCASGKAGGFLARGWGNGPTDQLHRKSFDMHKQLAKDLELKSFRKLPTLSVSTTGSRKMKGATDRCKWLDGHVSAVSTMDPDTAQVTPVEITEKMMGVAQKNGAKLIIGAVKGIQREDEGKGKVSAVILDDGKKVTGDVFVFTMGPWTVECEAWFPELRVPMVGIYSSSLIFQHKAGSVAPFALFCSEDNNGTHLEVYPRPEGDVYVCGCGGSRHLKREDIVKIRPENVVEDPKRVMLATKVFCAMSPTLGKKKPDIAQACMRPCTDDGMPMMGAIPGEPNAFVATGHNCWGILWGPVTGLAMSELILDGKSKCVNLKPFTPARFQVKKSRRSRTKGKEAVGEDW
ncbi:hypothetical protein AAMO2058_000027000 [Amorphochlora amoebiformis]